MRFHAMEKGLLSSEHGTHKTVKASFWPLLAGNRSTCSLFARTWHAPRPRRPSTGYGSPGGSTRSSRLQPRERERERGGGREREREGEREGRQRDPTHTPETMSGIQTVQGGHQPILGTRRATRGYFGQILTIGGVAEEGLEVRGHVRAPERVRPLGRV